MSIQSVYPSTPPNPYADLVAIEDFDELAVEIAEEIDCQLDAVKNSHQRKGLSIALNEKKQSFLQELDELKKTPCSQLVFAQRAAEMLREIEAIGHEARKVDAQFEKEQRVATHALKASIAHLEKPADAGYSAFKMGTPLFLKAIHHHKYAKPVHSAEMAVKMSVETEQNSVVEDAALNIGIHYGALRMAGGYVMGGVEAAVFIAENEHDLRKAADRLPEQFSDLERRSQLGCDGPTPEGARVIGKVLIDVAAPIGHAAEAALHSAVEGVKGVLHGIAKQGDYTTHNLSKEPI